VNKAALAIVLSVFSFSVWAAPQKFKIDPDHTSVVFKVNHLGFADVYGMFESVEGEISLDEKDLKNSSVVFKIKTASIDTNVKKRDEHLNSPDFFNTKQFPEMTFTSESIKKKGKNKYDVTGTLDLHGVKKKITIPIEQHRTGKDPWGKTRTGGSTQFSVKRSDYGMTYMQGKDQVGDQVDVMISAEAVLEEAAK
jgi:polyisoprenoid-binding protein YceI